MGSALVNRFEGRLFLEDGRLCMVVEADEASGIGRVSSRVDGTTQVVEMPLSDIGKRLSLGARMTLDGIGAATSEQRVQEDTDGWYFSAREGQKGPFPSRKQAQEALTRYIMKSQSA